MTDTQQTGNGINDNATVNGHVTQAGTITGTNVNLGTLNGGQTVINVGRNYSPTDKKH
jgi:hypothetical protein